jgi:hypothetical protein
MIIALSGWKGSGKDEFAKILVGQHGFRRVAFADVLKDMVAAAYGIDRTSLDDPERKEKPILSLPVSCQDKFSEHMFEIQKGELRDVDGFHGHSSTQQLYHTPRSLAILMGSVNRFVRSDYWVQRALSQIGGGDNVVITDMRFRSEAGQIQAFADANQHELKIVRIQRFAASRSQDPSERDLDAYEFRYVVDNTGGIEDLVGQANELVLT